MEIIGAVTRSYRKGASIFRDQSVLISGGRSQNTSDKTMNLSIETFSVEIRAAAKWAG